VQLDRCEFNVADIAELPELFRSTGVPDQHWVDVNGLKFAATEPVDRPGHVRDEFGELRFVVSRHRLACLPTTRLLGHGLR